MEKKGDKDSYWGLGILMGFVFVFWIWTWYSLKDVDDRGTFGDMFGAVNALFSGLAFAGIIYTIIIQKKELGLQRQELTLQRDEIKKSTEELAGQKEQMQIQRFEHTYFNLLSQHNELTSSLELSKDKSGRIVFLDIYNSMFNAVRSHGGKSEEEAFKQVYTSFHYLLHHYLNNIINIVQFVTNQSFHDEDKQVYISFLKAQLSSFELVMIYYFSDNNQHLLLLFNKYKFFSDLNRELLFSKDKAE